MNTSTLKKISLSCILLLIYGCGTTEYFEAKLQSWVGSPISEYIVTNSIAPAQVVSDASGGKIYIFEYQHRSSVTMPTTTYAIATVYGNTAYGTATTYGGQTIPINQQCTWTFVTDSRDIIQRWSWRGNACKSPAPKTTSKTVANNSSTLAITNTEGGNKFRAWVNDTYPAYAKEIALDRTGSYNNFHITEAWKKYGTEYNQLISNVMPCGKEPKAPPKFNDPQYKINRAYKEYKRAHTKWRDCMGYNKR